ncbi:MAG: cobalt-precorrin-5B (C(1))-methyltransferase [Methanosarcinaceae archaeon]|nr:cobalt-precorrin-5B (C(1))-methyltransferase [Methanosarcinaceae archaeon]
MIDPVNNFKIPDEWIARTKIPRHELEEGIASGMMVVLSDGSVLKRGYTTGTTASAAAKAAVISLKYDNIRQVSVPTPSGIRAQLDVASTRTGHAVVIKIANDHESDITRGLEFEASAKEADEIKIVGGKGIGIVTRDGFPVKKGSPAINPAPMKQIKDAVSEAINETGLKGAEVTISVPRGSEIAEKTLNGEVGVIGGISILGTTGFVEPWNDHLGEMKEDLIKDAPKVVLTTGRLGMRYSTMLFPDHTVVMIGSRISEGVEAAPGELVICGLPGLVLKWGDPEILTDSGFVTVVEMIAKEPENERLIYAFEQVIAKSGGARIVIVNRDGLVLMDSEAMDSEAMKSEEDK